MSKNKKNKQPVILNPIVEKTSTEAVSKDLMKYKKWYLAFSGLVIVPGLVFLGIFGLKTSIDFTGGSVLKFDQSNQLLDKEQIIQIFNQKGIEISTYTLEDGGKTVSLRTKAVDASVNDQLKQDVLKLNNGAKQTSFETVGPSIGAETAKKSLIAFALACVGIVFYIAYAFRNVPKPYSGLRFGVSAILAMIHDALVVLGAFSILGHFYNIEIDPMFITALLTIIGFSVHDTIVVFDRVRENLGKYKGKSFEWISNYSLLETLRRSIATSATVVITLASLFVFGGASIKWFVLALLIGIISGTYSSIFNAAPILVIWEAFLSRRPKKF